MISKMAILCIKGYQRYISPRKGFRCAYGVLHGTHGCSGAVIEILQKKGILAGVPAIRERFSACKDACEELNKQKEQKKQKKKEEADGECCLDPTDACDCVSIPSSCKSTPDCGDCTPDLSCDFDAC